MRRTILLLLIIPIITIGGYALFGSRTKLTITPTPSAINVTAPISAPESINYQAGFAIFTNGTFRIFTDSRYHNKSEEAFIQPENPNIVHVRKSNITWDDFFKTLPMQLTQQCLTTGTGQVFCSTEAQKLKFYLNGNEDAAALARPVRNGDRLLVSYGSETEEQIRLQMQQIPTVK